MSKSSAKLRRETLNDSGYAVTDFSKDINAGKTSHRATTIAKSYLSADNHIHVHIVWRRPSDFSDFCAIFQHTSSDKSCVTSYDAPSSIMHRTHPWAKSDTGAFRRDYNHNSMLVGVIEFLKSPKGGRRVTIATLVWLKSLDSCDIASEWLDATRGGLREFPLMATPLPKQMNRELGVFTDIVNDNTPSSRLDSKLTDQSIQSSPKIMDNQSDHNTKLNRGIRNIKHSYIQCSGLLALLKGNSVRVAIEKDLARLIESVDLLPCHIDSCTRPKPETVHWTRVYGEAM